MNISVGSPWVASAHVLASGFVRSLISAPKEFRRTCGYFPLNSDSATGPDTRPSTGSSSMAFRKASLRKTVYSYIENVAVHHRLDVLFFDTVGFGETS